MTRDRDTRSCSNPRRVPASSRIQLPLVYPDAIAHDAIARDAIARDAIARATGRLPGKIGQSKRVAARIGRFVCSARAVRPIHSGSARRLSYVPDWRGQVGQRTRASRRNVHYAALHPGPLGPDYKTAQSRAVTAARRTHDNTHVPAGLIIPTGTRRSCRKPYGTTRMIPTLRTTPFSVLPTTTIRPSG